MKKNLLVLILVMLSSMFFIDKARALPETDRYAVNADPENLLPPTLEAFIRAPIGTYPSPYVILTALSTSSETTGLRIEGTYGNKNFTCPNSSCALLVDGSGRINFKAIDQDGNVSKSVGAAFEVTQDGQGYITKITTLDQFIYFRDACASSWGLINANIPTWASFPQDPYELNTSKDLHYLGKQLVDKKAIDLSSCPNNGILGAGLSACGLELAKPHLEFWQNQFDLAIWRAAGDNGIPPKVLKTLIENETQFWPSTSANRLHIDEFGLAQITPNGIDVLLRTDPEYYYEVCNEAVSDCDVPYMSLPPAVQFTVRSYLSGLLNTDCPTCPYGISFDKATKSIDLIARVLKADCKQAKPYISYQDQKMDYEDSWKVALAIYNAGVGCVSSTYEEITSAGRRLNWDTYENNFTCVTGTYYVDKLWYSLMNFEENRKTNYALELVEPISPEPVINEGYTVNESSLTVQVFQDQNMDGVMQSEEGINKVEVLLSIPGFEPISVLTENGFAKFDLTGYPVGTRSNVSLVGYSKQTYFYVTQERLQTISFPFLPPINN